MEDKIAKRRMWIFVLLWAAVTAFILNNSLQPADASNARSHGIADWLYGFPVFRRWMTADGFHRFIRKLAHFAEFGASGLCVGGFINNLSRIKNEKYISLPLLIVLGTAVWDESIQLMSGRSSSVRDVLIDFAGALCGIAFMWLMSALSRKQTYTGGKHEAGKVNGGKAP